MSIMREPAMVDVFGEVKSAISFACAEVKHRSNRHWFGLVGRRHDVQTWRADNRDPCTFISAKRSFPTEARPDEVWIQQAINTSGAAHLLARTKCELLMYDNDYSKAEFAVLIATFKNKNANNDDATHEAGFPRILREIVVGRTPPVVHVFSVVEYGRRFYRSIIYSSNPRYCFAELKQKFDSRGTFFGDVAEKPDVKVSAIHLLCCFAQHISLISLCCASRSEPHSRIRPQ